MQQATNTKSEARSIGTLDWDACKSCLFRRGDRDGDEGGCDIAEKKFVELLLYDGDGVYCNAYKRDSDVEVEYDG